MAEEKTDGCCSNCVFPPCPKCRKGYLVPFSFKEDVFEKWKCTECGHTVFKQEGRERY